MASTSIKHKNLSTGEIEAHVLAQIERLRSPGVRLEDARRLAPWRSANVQAALNRLVRKGRLIRLARGRYYLATADPTQAACHAWAPSYVSFLTVLADAGFTDQIPGRLDLAYAQTTLRRRDWRGLPMTWHPIPPDAFQGYHARPDGVLAATPAKAAADLVHRQRDFGGLTPYRGMIEGALRRRPRPEIRDALEAYRAHSGTLRRLLLLKFGKRAPAADWAGLVPSDLHNPIPLDPLADRNRSENRTPLNVLEAAR